MGSSSYDQCYKFVPFQIIPETVQNHNILTDLESQFYQTNDILDFQEHWELSPTDHKPSCVAFQSGPNNVFGYDWAPRGNSSWHCW